MQELSFDQKTLAIIKALQEIPLNQPPHLVFWWLGANLWTVLSLPLKHLALRTTIIAPSQIFRRPATGWQLSRRLLASCLFAAVGGRASQTLLTVSPLTLQTDNGPGGASKATYSGMGFGGQLHLKTTEYSFFIPGQSHTLALEVSHGSWVQKLQ